MSSEYVKLDDQEIGYVGTPTSTCSFYLAVPFRQHYTPKPIYSGHLHWDRRDKAACSFYLAVPFRQPYTPKPIYSGHLHWDRHDKAYASIAKYDFRYLNNKVPA